MSLSPGKLEREYTPFSLTAKISHRQELGLDFEDA